MKAKDKWRLHHALEEIDDIASFLNEGTKDKKTMKAIVRSIEIIGEAVRAISPEFKTQHPDIAWQKITDMRNFVAHEYFRTDEELVWKAAADDVPELAGRYAIFYERTYSHANL